MNEGRSLTQTLASFIAGGGAVAPGAAEIRAACTSISDAIGCMAAGAATDVGRIVAKVAVANAAAGRATIIGGPGGLSAQAAALVNGSSGHALDYDDVGWTMYGHPSVAILPAALAAAQQVGASGRELVAAFTIGVEVAAKIGRWANPQHYEHGFHATATVGVFGATAAACKLYALDEQQTTMALGIAASQACGVRRNFGSMTKPFHAGNAARAGLMAAELAREGMSSDVLALEGAAGWFKTLQARSMPTPQELAEVLGRPWDVTSPGIVLKLYPACGSTHCALDAMIALKREHGFAPEDIESIRCDAHPLGKKVLLHSRPVNGLEGKFSMEYCIAVAAVSGKAGLEQFEQHWVDDPRVRALLPRIAFESRDDLAQGLAADAVPADLSVNLRDGRTLRSKVMVPIGDPRNPMPAAERQSKFIDCTSAMLPAAQARELWQSLERLEEVRDVTALLAGLSQGAAK